MMYRIAEPATICPRFHIAIELVGKRWTGAILMSMFRGSTRFSDMVKAVPGLSDRLLSERLKELEAAGIVRRDVSDIPGQRIEYHLTEKGAALNEVIHALSGWAEHWIDRPAD